ncbi:MAG: ABC transporter permease, partial [Solirubrobacteraceae bacterium]
MSSPAAAAPLGAIARPRRRHPLTLLLQRSLRQRRTKIGAALVLLLVGVAVIGPEFAPHAPADFVGAPYSHPSSSALLGTDNLGRDV